MGDKSHCLCILDAEGKVIQRDVIANTAGALRGYFGRMKPCLIALEAGTHSGWVSRLLEQMGYEVLIGNPRKMKFIYKSNQKTDERDAETLARAARFDPELLHPIHHRGDEAQRDLGTIRARGILVKMRSMSIAHVRGVVKTFGARIPLCSPESFHRKAAEHMPAKLSVILEPIVASIGELTVRIRHYDRLIDEMCETKYQETAGLRSIVGMGPITSLCFVLTLEESSRFKRSRDVGPYIGLTPRKDQSGNTDKQLPITKAGDQDLRRLLVQCAQYILQNNSPDCDLKRFGLKLAARGGKNARKRALIAMARKLAVLMHCLWKNRSIYNPVYGQTIKTRSMLTA